MSETKKEEVELNVDDLLKLAATVLEIDRRIILFQKEMLNSLVEKLKKYENVDEYEKILEMVNSNGEKTNENNGEGTDSE